MIVADQYFDRLIYSLFALLVVCFSYTAYNSNYIRIYKKSPDKAIFFIFALTLILFLGFRLISDVFGDMNNYKRYFSIITESSDVNLFYGSDILFVKYIQLCTKIMDVKIWFFVTSFITIALQYIAIKRLFPKVFKLRGGAGAANVKLVKSKRDFIKLINKAFGRGFSQFNR